ncbi:aminoglycoside phosphotransferase family protein [Nonomuraea fuscirosea]|uniref:aminoglycoside phosphotransferase family protein n=1 Tax=Nonomuraea fuscirosea TaxID=1291556 RepID=UPI003790E3F5
MSSDIISLAVRRFGITIDRDDAEPADARSGAGLHSARTFEGRTAFLKVTPASLGVEALHGARRELRFYTELAATVPLRTPPLFDSLETEAGVAVLLAHAGDRLPAREWTDRAWSELGRDLAAMHAMPGPLDESWNGPQPLLAALAEPATQTITEFWGVVLPQLPQFLAARMELRAELAAQPAVFVHGDCHTSNIVHDTSGLVFCDWQSAGIGRSSSDLAFVNVRAVPDGALVSPAATIAYLDRCGGSRAAFERALLLEELAIFVFQWPPFAAYNSALGISRVHDRVRYLSERWFTITPGWR